MFDSYERTPDLEAAIIAMANHNETNRGAVFTRPEVVESILDLVGYSIDRELHTMRLLEPSFGAGDFLLAAVRRLLVSYQNSGGATAKAGKDLRDAIQAVEIHVETYDQTFLNLKNVLVQWGMRPRSASYLCKAWLINDDFLLASIKGRFDFVVGNPPYVRQERINSSLLAEYRRRYKTLFDRADLYVPFFERSLDLLSDDGVLGYICANRWLKNRYGGPLREKISSGYWLKYFVGMESFKAFFSDVIAYPAITIIQRSEKIGVTRAVGGEGECISSLAAITKALRSRGSARGVVEEIVLKRDSDEPLLLDDIPRLALLRRIERDFHTIEQAQCKVGIGVATGCDRVYIKPRGELPVESERKLPIVMAKDLIGGEIHWGENELLNPFDESGALVAIDEYPKFKRYLMKHHGLIAARNVARRNELGWFRTIDKVHPELLKTPKILVPDIKGEGVFVIDEGRYYPHHNLYFITSREWDLRALQAVLRSSLTLMTVATYCTRMAGGFLRFQAQYLRRIRVPAWNDVDSTMRERLVSVARSNSQNEIDKVVGQLFGLNSEDAEHVSRVAASIRANKGKVA
ncbi:Eco57I restriction-modification methylase domain-containing protein [Lysobacter yananisis]|uniref:site-specific DNA-methyltransferase (adenine-specific) n=1 Tax=Lysobacter yananisis TaxID=1003114 RepID=A0ABY9PD92_9GAMM|nr:Eco57I restriction-modification methylase domain-containing protein [Lysobacter yananisis]WMT05043.1 Eco57I restriction-modification methylase domain-containing protein [Lysobacter yananisis]